LQNLLATPGSSVDLAPNRREHHVARKTKIETEKQADSAGATGGQASVIGSRSKSSVAIPKPKRTKATPKKRKAATIKPAASEKNPPSAMFAEPSDEEIRLRAYFIAERRFRLSLPGDSDNDWIEARRQLIDEAAPR
jgi:Protein of unknown function (DUF2934)